jgi:hypothetical protein
MVTKITYDTVTTKQLIDSYKAGTTVSEIAATLGVPTRSVIAKLSSLGVYVKKTYVNKQGNAPISKATYIDTIAELLNCNSEMLESLEKTNKSVLVMLVNKLQDNR